MCSGTEIRFGAKMNPLFSGGKAGLILMAAALALIGCHRQTPAPAPGVLTVEGALARVRQSLPAAGYVTNELLSTAGLPAEPAAGPVIKLRVGLPWVLNDEIAPWFIGIEKGFFRDEGLELDLVPGGPGIDPMLLLLGGRLDIAVLPVGVGLVDLMASPTKAAVVAVGAVLKGSPYCLIGIDNSVPSDQPSQRRLQPSDFIGKRIGLQGGAEYFASFLTSELHLRSGSFRIMRVGFTPDPLLGGAVDYFGGFIVNQPAMIEQAGHRNWDAFHFSDWGWTDFADVSVVRRETLNARPDEVRRYLRATTRALRFMLDHPDEAAAITARRATAVPLTPAMVRRRLDLERDLIIGVPGSRLQEMPLDSWDRLAARLLSSGVISLPPPRPGSGS
jgi:ABC-type nitrate/sulfonate/bicarbonate transport system substrate-binding protein